MGVNGPLIAKWEKPGSDPKLSTVIRLAAALGCRVIDLVGED